MKREIGAVAKAKPKRVATTPSLSKQRGREEIAVWVLFHGYKGAQLTGFRKIDDYDWRRHGLRRATLLLPPRRGR